MELGSEKTFLYETTDLSSFEISRGFVVFKVLYLKWKKTFKVKTKL